MAEHIIGLKEYGEQISAADKKLRNGRPLTDRNLPFLDFREYPFRRRRSGRRSHAARFGSTASIRSSNTG